MIFWVFLYKKVQVPERRPQKLLPYFVISIITLLVTVTVAIGGIRGDFKHEKLSNRFSYFYGTAD